jgi:hypothetical protein
MTVLVGEHSDKVAVTWMTHADELHNFLRQIVRSVPVPICH